MSNKRLPIVVFLLIAVALSLVAVSRSQASHSPGAISLLYIDVDTSGNTATTLGTAEGCRSVAPLESFTIDIAIADWPANGDTLVGFEADLNYDPSVLSVTAVDYGMLLMAAGGTPVSFGEPVPDSDGIFLQSVFDIVGPEESSGGVLARITLEGQGAGQSELTLTTPGAFIGTSEANGLYVPVDAVNRAWVAVDQSCVPGVQPGPAAPPFPPSACTPGPDADANGFSDCLEAFYGTNPNLNCASPGDPDTWPPDVDGNNWVNILDPLDFRQEWRATPAGGGYSARLDLYPDLQINLTDILVLMTWWNVTCVPAPDGDGDGWQNALDNCPAAANAGQENADGDQWGDVCDECPATSTAWFVPPGDTDCDAFTDADEALIGTNAGDGCGFTPGGDTRSDVWPPDLVESDDIDVFDVLALKLPFGQDVPPADARFDLVPNGTIDIFDVLRMKPVFGSSCTP